MKRRTFLKALGAAVLAPVATIKALSKVRLQDIKHKSYSMGFFITDEAAEDWAEHTRRAKALALSARRTYELHKANILNNAFTSRPNTTIQKRLTQSLLKGFRI